VTSAPTKQLASQIQYKGLVTLGYQPMHTSVLREHDHHQAASWISFARLFVDDVDVFGAWERRCCVDVKQGRNLFDFGKCGALQRLVNETYAEDVQTCKRGMLFSGEGLADRSNQVRGWKLLNLSEGDVVRHGLVVDVVEVRGNLVPLVRERVVEVLGFLRQVVDMYEHLMPSGSDD